jgi:hypothetical protein
MWSFRVWAPAVALQGAVVVLRSHSEDALKDTRPFAEARRRFPVVVRPVAL